MHIRLTRLLAVLALLALFAAACGNDSDSDDGDSADATDASGDGDDGGADTADDVDGSDTDDAADADGDGDDGDVDDGGTDDDSAAGDDGTDDVASGNCDATVAGSEVRYTPFANTASYDPPYSTGTIVGGTQLAAIYDVLMRFNPDTGEFDPQLAEGMSSNDDFTVWTLTLREGVTFEDGTPLDAQMVLDNIDRYSQAVEGRSLINNSPAFLQFIDSSEIIDDVTIEFTLTQPWAQFPFVFNDEPGMIVNTNAIGDDPVAFGAQPPAAAGVGPYILDSVTPGEEAVFKARQDYWGGPVCVETVIFDLASFVAAVGNQAVYEAYVNGDTDIAFLRDDAVVAQAREDGASLNLAAQDAGGLFMFNVREGTPLSDPVLREAVALAIDLDTINDRAYGGIANMGKSIWLEGSQYYRDDVEAIGTDAERAAELVAESGFTGTLRLLCQTSPQQMEITLALEAMLESAGMDVEFENLAITDQIAKLSTGDYDIGCWSISAGPDTAVTALLRNLNSTSPVNRQGYVSAEMDALLTEAMATPADELTDVMVRINNLYVSEFLGIPTLTVEEGIATRDGIEGIKQTGSTIFLLDDLYLADA